MDTFGRGQVRGGSPGAKRVAAGAQACSAGLATFVLAGGEGRRLLPLTEAVPKPAVPFGPEGRIVDFTLENCLSSGISTLALLTQYRPAPLEEYVARRFAPRFRAAGGALALVRAGAGGTPAYPGTADAVLESARSLPSDFERVLVLAADHVYRMDYRAFIEAHGASEADLTIGAVEVPLADASRFGVLEAEGDGRVARFAEKPASPAPIPGDPARALASMGIYVFRREALLEARRALGSGPGADFGRDVLPALLRLGARVRVHRHVDPASGARGLWFDVGTPEALLDALLALHPEGAAARGASVAAGASVSRCVMREGCRIEEGAVLRESFLLDDALVERGARLERVIVGPGARVPAGAVLGPGRGEPGRVTVVAALGAARPFEGHPIAEAR